MGDARHEERVEAQLREPALRRRDVGDGDVVAPPGAALQAEEGAPRRLAHHPRPQRRAREHLLAPRVAQHQGAGTVARLDDGAELYVSAPRTTIEDSQFDHSSGAGLKLAASDVVVQRTTISDNAAEGLQGNRIHRAVIRRNQFLRNNTDRFTVEGCGDSCTIAGFKAAHTDDLTVADNAFVANAGNGFWCDLGCTDVVVTRNAISGGFDGIFYEAVSYTHLTLPTNREV